jgi:hypothetical protein
VRDGDIAGTYAAGTFTYSATGAAEIDGVTLAVGDRVLLAGQTDATQNGIYEITVAGDGSTSAVLTRSNDFNESGEIYDGVRIAVAQGGAYAESTWKLTTDAPIVLDTSDLNFTQDTGIAHTNKYAATITGDDATTTFPITHDLNSTDIDVQIRNLTTGNPVLTDYTVVDSDNITVSFSVAPATTQSYRVVIVG